MSRTASIVPVALLLVGAAAGVSWAMLNRQEPRERAHVYLDDSLPPTMIGAALGLMAGTALSAICRRRPGWNLATEILIPTLLGASMAAPLGWIVGDNQRVREPRVGMACGVCGGAIVGLGLGLLRLVGRVSDPSPGDVATTSSPRDGSETRPTS